MDEKIKQGHNEEGMLSDSSFVIGN